MRHLTLEHRMKIGLANSIALKGKKLSEKTKHKLSESLKKAYIEGRKKSTKGYKHSEETKLKIKKNNARYWLGKKRNWTWKNIGEYQKGKPSWNKGLKMSDEARKNNSLAQLGKKLSEETKRKMSLSRLGNKNPAWNGGKSFKKHTPDFNAVFRRLIRDRDGCCMLCNIGLNDLKLIKKDVHVHHIDYNRFNSIKQNCITLCNSCHTKTNANRKHWILFFQSLLKEKYGYEYTEDQKIILDFMEGSHLAYT